MSEPPDGSICFASKVSWADGELFTLQKRGQFCKSFTVQQFQSRGCEANTIKMVFKSIRRSLPFIKILLCCFLGNVQASPNLVLETGESKIPVFQSAVDFLKRTSLSENIFNIDVTSMAILVMLKIIIAFVFLANMASGRRTSFQGRSISSSNQKPSLTHESEMEWTGDTCFIMYSLGFTDKLGCIAR